MMAEQVKKKWRTSRPAAFREIFRRVWEELKATDFAEEPVAIRDERGHAIIRRRSRAAVRDMAKLQARKQMRELGARPW
jgi:hypothetical protein